MKLFGILGALVIVVIVGAFAYIATSEPPIVQKVVTKDIDPGLTAEAPATVAPAAGAPANPPATAP